MNVTRLAIVTDAWHPQTNGVVNTLSRLVDYLRVRAVEVAVFEPGGFHSVPLPGYSEIRLAADPWRLIGRLRAFAPDAVHVATEGPLGVTARLWLADRRLGFTTSFHTRFPEYVHARLPVPLAAGYGFERWFHGAARHTLVGTRSLIGELEALRVGRQLVHWPRGVDTELFDPGRRRLDVFPYPRPIWLHVGRVAVEKSIEDFLRLDLPGTKVVVGDGPSRPELERRFPRAVWRGWRRGEELAAHYASADCFVFPSRTDTFGNVLLEAMASGLPVAAVPAPGPIDLVEEGRNGALDFDLAAACLRALQASSNEARRVAQGYTWTAAHERFRAHLVPLKGESSALPGAARFSPAPRPTAGAAAARP